MKQIVDHGKIAAALSRWCAEIGAPAKTTLFPSSAREIAAAISSSWKARRPKGVKGASPAWEAWHAKSGSAATRGRDAWDTPDARIAWAAPCAVEAQAIWNSTVRHTWRGWHACAIRDAYCLWNRPEAWRHVRQLGNQFDLWRILDSRKFLWDAAWLSIMVVGAVSLNDMKTAHTWLPIFEAFEAGAFAFLIVDAEIFVATIPTTVAVDPGGHLHSPDGPAFAWLDIRDYYWHDALVGEDLIKNPQSITACDIDREADAEVRRIMIERYRHGDEISGAAAYIRDTAGELLDHDERCGTLWRRRIEWDEPIVMLEVVNATREQDGRFKRYWLRVPPTMSKAREAVAWTFGMSADEYQPLVET
ncbi:MAG: DUF6745 domain-containing protein [Xanthobacteraceae bacterium]